MPLFQILVLVLLFVIAAALVGIWCTIAAFVRRGAPPRPYRPFRFRN